MVAGFSEDFRYKGINLQIGVENRRGFRDIAHPQHIIRATHDSQSQCRNDSRRNPPTVAAVIFPPPNFRMLTVRTSVMALQGGWMAVNDADFEPQNRRLE